MKLPKNLLAEESSHQTVGLNTFSLLGVSLVWAHLLSLLSLWWLPLTIVCLMVGYGTEIQPRKKPQTLSL